MGAQAHLRRDEDTVARRTRGGRNVEWAVRRTTEHTEGRRLAIALSLVALTAIVHRVTLFLLHRGDLDALIDANASWYTPQNLPAELLRDHLLTALLYLQQTPPVSNLLMGLALKSCAWPTGVAHLFIGMQTLVTILAAMVLVHLVSILYPSRTILWIAVGGLFVLDTDLVVIEYTSMGQTIYGPISMLLVLGITDRLVALRRTGSLWDAAFAGLAMGLLVLTRPSWTFFSLPCLLLVAVLAPWRQMRAVLACVVPIMALQGGWAVKNYAIYGVLSPTTSTWGGLHATTGLWAAGLGDEYTRFVGVIREPEQRRTMALLGWGHDDPSLLDSETRALLERDRAIEQSMGVPNPSSNSLAFRTVCAEAQRRVFDFAWQHPRAMLTKWWRGYAVFWQPIANYGQQFVGLFAVGNRITDSFDFPEIAHKFLAGELPDTPLVKSGSHPISPEHKGPLRLTPTTLYTARWIEPLVLMLNVVGVHLLLPFVAIVWLAGAVRRHAPFNRLRIATLLVAGTGYAYLALLVNLVETYENMRYRSEVEPLIWLITLICVTEVAGLVQGQWARRA